VLDPDLVSLLEGGCALIVGVSTADGLPFASRAWGLQIAPPAADDGEDASFRIRFFLGDDDHVVLDRVAAGAPIAVTGADVITLRSVQLKGTALGVAPATDEDRERSARYFNAFAADIAQADGQPRHLLARLVPPGIVACTAVATEAYDQTPGPRAGSEVATP
jgi:hypothetical protein